MIKLYRVDDNTISQECFADDESDSESRNMEF